MIGSLSRSNSLARDADAGLIPPNKAWSNAPKDSHQTEPDSSEFFPFASATSIASSRLSFRFSRSAFERSLTDVMPLFNSGRFHSHMISGHLGLAAEELSIPSCDHRIQNAGNGGRHEKRAATVLVAPLLREHMERSGRPPFSRSF